MPIIYNDFRMFSAVSFATFLIPFIPTLGSLASIFLTLPAFRWVETYGRKQLLVKSLILCAVSQYLMLIFSLLAEKVPESWGSIGFAFAFVIFGLGYVRTLYYVAILITIFRISAWDLFPTSFRWKLSQETRRG